MPDEIYAIPEVPRTLNAKKLEVPVKKILSGIPVEKAVNIDSMGNPQACSVDRFAYLPFGDGPRICIGASFALQEAVIILATILARFRFTAVPGRDPKPVMILTLRPEGGVWLEVERV